MYSFVRLVVVVVVVMVIGTNVSGDVDSRGRPRSGSESPRAIRGATKVIVIDNQVLP